MIIDRKQMLNIEERLELLKLSLEDDKNNFVLSEEKRLGIDLALSSLLIYVPELKGVEA